MRNLWVAPEHMRQGFGRALLFHALQTAALGGASFIHIDADPNAESFYVACGATRIGEVPAAIEGPIAYVHSSCWLSRALTLETPEFALRWKSVDGSLVPPAGIEPASES